MYAPRPPPPGSYAPDVAGPPRPPADYYGGTRPPPPPHWGSGGPAGAAPTPGPPGPPPGGLGYPDGAPPAPTFNPHVRRQANLVRRVATLVSSASKVKAQPPVGMAIRIHWHGLSFPSRRISWIACPRKTARRFCRRYGTCATIHLLQRLLNTSIAAVSGRF